MSQRYFSRASHSRPYQNIMVYSLTNLRTDFKAYVGDSSLVDATCDYRLNKSYTRSWNRLWNSDARYELPIVISHQTPVYDTVNLTYYVTIPDTYLARRFPNNEQISQEHVGTVGSGSWKVYVRRGKTNQVIEALPAITYPTANVQFASDLVPEIIVLDASYRFHSKVTRDLDLANVAKIERTEAISLLNQKYAQQFIYNEND